MDVLSRRILEYGLVKAERVTNLVWHYFRKFCPKKLAAKRPATDPLRLQDHALCMLCYESTDQDRKEHCTVKLGKCKSPTAMVDHMQKHHKEEWAELHTAGKQQQSMKSFTAQHSLKRLSLRLVPRMQHQQSVRSCVRIPQAARSSMRLQKQLYS